MAQPHDPSAALNVHQNVLTTIGNTPLIRLNSVGRDLPHTLYAKVEFFNPGGSVKDRIALTMIEDAERSGRLRPGGTIIEGTSGNTGVGLAIAAALKGYRCIFVMPDKMSEEKIRLLRAFGARVVITPTAVEPDDPRSYYSVSERLVRETPNSILANQYHNPANPQAHYETTGPELWQQTQGKIDVFVAGMGTGGTISGVGRYLKEQNPHVRIVGVDPVGSLLHDYFKTGQLTEARTYKVEGIGEDFLPSVYDWSVFDDVVQVTDKESFLMTRRLVREEGLFVGGSCGSAVAGMLKYARTLPPGQTIVTLLPDSGSRYLSKIFDDTWMKENGYFASQWGDGRLRDVLRTKEFHEVITASPNDTKLGVIQRLKQHKISQVPVVDPADGRLLGIVTEIDLLNHLLSGGDGHIHGRDETIADIVQPAAGICSLDTSLDVLGEIFTHENVAIVLEDGRVAGILTKIDLIDYYAGLVTA